MRDAVALPPAPPTVRRRLLALGLAAAAAVAVAACSTGTGTPTGDRVRTGTLTGFHHPSAQCLYLMAGGDRFSLDLPDGVTVTFDPGGPADDDVTVLDQAGSVLAEEGDRVEVRGIVESLPAGAPCGATQILRADELTVLGS